MQPERSSRYCSRPIALLAAILSLAGCGADDAPTDPAGVLFINHCSTCHGQQGQGRPPTFPPLVGSEALTHGPEAVALVVLLGISGEIEVAGQVYRGYMPPLRHLSDEEISRIVTHVGQWADWTELPDANRIAGLREAVADRQTLQGREGLEALLRDLDHARRAAASDPADQES